MSNSSSKKTDLIGPVRGLHDGNGFVVIEGQDNISLSKQDMRRVFPGDVVAVRPGKTDARGRIQGRIVEIIERNTAELVGRFCDEQGLCFVQPSNSRIGQDVQVPRNETAGATAGQMVVVEITEQPGDHAPPSGRVVEVLGDELAAGMEIQVALHEFGIPHEWPDEVNEEADDLGSRVRPQDKERRLDLRELPFVTIDGEDARDFDDAVYARPEGDGWRLWVAIADVSYYVEPGSALDDEAMERGTSVYFPNYVVPMLPEVLSNGLCSLKPQVDRLSLVCEMHINARGEVGKFHFSEAVIQSHERLTYNRVAQVLAERGADETPERDRLGGLCQQVDDLHRLYQLLYRARKKRGAMEFESVEVRFEFNEDRKIERIVPVVRNDAHKLIEECMLAANICAAAFLENNDIPGLYRVHMPPANEKLAALRENLSDLGLSLGGGAEPTTADFLKLSEAMAGRPDEHLIQMQILRSQQQAVYQPENKGHFGLAYDAYAHFTSPIRRYPDLLMHRAIRAAIRCDKKMAHVKRVEGASVQPFAHNYPYDLAQMEVFGQNCSVYERRAEDATRDVIQWLKCEFLQKHLGDRFDGVVATVAPFGLFVELSELYVEGLIHITNLPSDYYEYDAAKQRLIGQNTGRTFKIGDKVLVQVARVDLDERKIDFELTNSRDSSAAPKNSKTAGGDESSGRKSRALSNRSSGRSLSDGAQTSENHGAQKSKKQRQEKASKNRSRGSKTKSRRGK